MGPYNSIRRVVTHLKSVGCIRIQGHDGELESSRVISTNPDPDSGSESDNLNNSNLSVCVQKPEDFVFYRPFLPSEEIMPVPPRRLKKGGGV